MFGLRTHSLQLLMLEMRIVIRSGLFALQFVYLPQVQLQLPIQLSELHLSYPNIYYYSYRMLSL